MDPNPSTRGRAGGEVVKVQVQDDSFRYLELPEAYAVDLDPRRVGFSLLDGWDREADAYGDRNALAFVSGPMYERHVNENGREITLPLGDIKLGEQIWRGRNLSAARERAYLGIRHNGQVDFGYGELTPERARRYETFIGGLHSIYNDLAAAPASYKGAYSIGMGQKIRYVLPRIRVIYGLRPDGRLELLMSRDGLTLEQTRALARQRGLLAAYLPDHASKSRLIVPGVKGFSSEDANWISGGATSFVHVPYLLRLQLRHQALRGSLLAGLRRRLPAGGCGTALQCSQQLGERLLDRALAGFNRLMEEGVEPVARLFWAPRHGAVASRQGQKAPFREPVITADPRVLRLRQQQESQPQPEGGKLASATPASPGLPEAPELPPPSRAVEAMEAPAAPGSGPRLSAGDAAAPQAGASAPDSREPSPQESGNALATPARALAASTAAPPLLAPPPLAQPPLPTAAANP